MAVEVHGADGLAVTSDPTPLSGGCSAPGEAVTFDVAFGEGPGRSQLAVSLSGDFGGARRSTVASFAVGTPAPDQLEPAGTSTNDSAGQRIKVMPVDGK